MHRQTDMAFFLFAAVISGFVALLPNAFIHIASYGGRMSYRPSPMMIKIMRICAVVACLGALVALVR